VPPVKTKLLPGGALLANAGTNRCLGAQAYTNRYLGQVQRNADHSIDWCAWRFAAAPETDAPPEKPSGAHSTCRYDRRMTLSPAWRQGEEVTMTPQVTSSHNSIVGRPAA
jgi:hypothetical protein